LKRGNHPLRQHRDAIFIAFGVPHKELVVSEFDIFNTQTHGSCKK